MVKKAYDIPEVPAETLNLEDNTWLKNLAGWIARYKNLGAIDQNGFSPILRGLSEDGTLAKFEPSLEGFRAGQSASDDEYDLYEFSAQLEDIVTVGGGWVTAYFVFLANNVCKIIVCETGSGSSGDALSVAKERVFNIIGINEMLPGENEKDVTWQEADEIILKGLKYLKNPEIPVVPES